jgi:hypothetical protein
MWITLFFWGSVKKIFEEVNALERPVYGTFLPATINTSDLLHPNSGVDRIGFMFQFSPLIQKKMRPGI